LILTTWEKKKRNKILVTSIAVVVVIAFASTYAYANYFGPKTVLQTNPDSINCRQGNVLDGVDRQARFTVLSTCKKVLGVVHDMKQTKEDDGDYQFNIAVNGTYKRFLNDQNNKQVNGMLVVEIIPKDQGSVSVNIPKNGDLIEVYGSWVTDNPHGWNEIHPAWKSRTV
jgi:cell division protein YceG involved in septum cleavage